MCKNFVGIRCQRNPIEFGVWNVDLVGGTYLYWEICSQSHGIINLQAYVHVCQIVASHKVNLLVLISPSFKLEHQYLFASYRFSDWRSFKP